MGEVVGQSLFLLLRGFHAVPKAMNNSIGKKAFPCTRTTNIFALPQLWCLLSVILSDEYTAINWSANVHYFVLHSSFFSFCAPTCPYSDDAMYLHCVFCLKNTGAGCLFQPIVSSRPSVSPCPQGHREKLRKKKVSSKVRTPGKEKRTRKGYFH